MRTVKPLFIPLRAEYFRQVEAGTKTTEYRRYGRCWHERTCVPGRPVVLSHGYSGSRLYGRLVAFSVMRRDSDVYGPDALLAAIEIALDPSLPESVRPDVPAEHEAPPNRGNTRPGG
jgi:hypothetical protein